jgi:hypothetical protein
VLLGTYLVHFSLSIFIRISMSDPILSPPSIYRSIVRRFFSSNAANSNTTSTTYSDSPARSSDEVIGSTTTSDGSISFSEKVAHPTSYAGSDCTSETVRCGNVTNIAMSFVGSGSTSEKVAISSASAGVTVFDGYNSTSELVANPTVSAGVTAFDGYNSTSEKVANPTVSAGVTAFNGYNSTSEKVANPTASTGSDSTSAVVQVGDVTNVNATATYDHPPETSHKVRHSTPALCDTNTAFDGHPSDTPNEGRGITTSKKKRNIPNDGRGITTSKKKRNEVNELELEKKKKKKKSKSKSSKKNKQKHLKKVMDFDPLTLSYLGGHYASEGQVIPLCNDQEIGIAGTTNDAPSTADHIGPNSIITAACISDGINVGHKTKSSTVSEKRIIKAFIDIIDFHEYESFGFRYIFRLVDPENNYGHCTSMKGKEGTHCIEALIKVLSIARIPPSSIHFDSEFEQIIDIAPKYPYIEFQVSPPIESVLASRNKFTELMKKWMREHHGSFVFGATTVQAVCNTLPVL